MRFSRGQEEGEKSQLIPSLIYDEQDPFAPAPIPTPARLPAASLPAPGYAAWGTQRHSNYSFVQDKASFEDTAHTQYGDYHVGGDVDPTTLVKSQEDVRYSLNDASLNSVMVRRDKSASPRPPSHVHFEDDTAVIALTTTDNGSEGMGQQHNDWQHKHTTSFSSLYSLYSSQASSRASQWRGPMQDTLVTAPPASQRVSNASDYAATSFSHSSYSQLLPPPHATRQTYSEVQSSHVDTPSSEPLMPVNNLVAPPPPLLTLSVVSGGYPAHLSPHHDRHRRQSKRTSAMNAAASGLEPVSKKHAGIPSWFYIVGTIMGSALALATIVLSIEVH